MKQAQIRALDHDVLSAWREETILATTPPSLKQQLLYRQDELLPCFATHYRRLTSLSRQVRRNLQRRSKRSLAGLALLLALGAHPALGAVIHVGGKCTLARAIISANRDASPGRFCARGHGADTIVLPRASKQILTKAFTTPFGPTGLPTISSAITIAGNRSTIRRASTARGFRIFSVGETGNFRLLNTTVSGGLTAGDGGGVLDDNGVVTIINSTISGNRAGYDGGGVDIAHNGSATITGSRVTGNYCARFGGGVNNEGPGKLTITNSTIDGNAAGLFAGGVDNGTGTLAINHSTISGNSSESRGGVSNSNSATITNSTISGNTASEEYGGGVSNFGTLTIVHSTISGNIAAEFAGGVFNRFSATLTLARTLISGNTADTGAEIGNDKFNAGIISAANFNVLGHSELTNAQAFEDFVPDTSDIAATSDGNKPTPLAGILDANLADNGGPTQTHDLPVGSPAVDVITDGACPPPFTDQRGIMRPQDGNADGAAICDVGALER